MSDLHVPGYDLGDLLGYGATGEVWAARDRVSHAAVALKRMRVPDDESRERLLREATVLSRVTHPHVVRLLDVVPLDDGVVLVLEHAAGGSLRRLLAERERLTPGEVVTLLVPLAQALAAVHAHGVVHGDVTPGNVLLSADGRPLLADLGVSRLLGVAAPDVDATAGYVDPAVTAGAAPGPASDVHGLAATCWAALTGRPPYDAMGRRQGTRPPEAAAAELTALLETALGPDPATRPDPAALAAAAFRAAPPEPLRRPGLPLDVRVTADGEAATYRVRSSRPEPEEAPTRSRRRRSGRPAVWRRGRGSAPTRPAVPGGTVGATADSTPATNASSAPTPAAAPAAPGTRRRQAPARRPGGRTASVLRRLLAGLLVAAGLALAGLTLASARSGGAPGADPSSPPRQGASPMRREHDQRPATPGAQTSAAAARVDAPARRPVTVGGPAPPAPSWAAVLRGLDERRSAAFARADPDALDEVYATASPALRRDRDLLATLVARGMRAEGVRLRATSVALRARLGDRVVLRVVDVLEPFHLRSVDSGRVTPAPGRGTRTWQVTLQRAGARWEVYDVAAA